MFLFLMITSVMCILVAFIIILLNCWTTLYRVEVKLNIQEMREQAAAHVSWYDHVDQALNLVQ